MSGLNQFLFIPNPRNLISNRALNNNVVNTTSSTHSSAIVVGSDLKPYGYHAIIVINIAISLFFLAINDFITPGLFGEPFTYLKNLPVEYQVFFSLFGGPLFVGITNIKQGYNDIYQFVKRGRGDANFKMPSKTIETTTITITGNNVAQNKAISKVEIGLSDIIYQRLRTHFKALYMCGIGIVAMLFIFPRNLVSLLAFMTQIAAGNIISFFGVGINFLMDLLTPYVVEETQATLKNYPDIDKLTFRQLADILIAMFKKVFNYLKSSSWTVPIATLIGIVTILYLLRRIFWRKSLKSNKRSFFNKKIYDPSIVDPPDDPDTQVLLDLKNTLSKLNTTMEQTQNQTAQFDKKISFLENNQKQTSIFNEKIMDGREFTITVPASKQVAIPLVSTLPDPTQQVKPPESKPSMFSRFTQMFSRSSNEPKNTTVPNTTVPNTVPNTPIQTLYQPEPIYKTLDNPILPEPSAPPEDDYNLESENESPPIKNKKIKSGRVKSPKKKQKFKKNIKMYYK